jgi:hypothetical protein
VTTHGFRARPISTLARCGGVHLKTAAELGAREKKKFAGSSHLPREQKKGDLVELNPTRSA